MRFGCEAKYQLRGSAVLTCERGGGERPHWDSTTPLCVGKHEHVVGAVLITTDSSLHRLFTLGNLAALLEECKIGYRHALL